MYLLVVHYNNGITDEVLVLIDFTEKQIKSWI